MVDHKYSVEDDYDDLKKAVTDSSAPDEEKPALNSSKADLVAWLNGDEPEADDNLSAEEQRASESANPFNLDAREIVVGDTPVPTRDENTPPYGRYAVEDNELDGYVGVDDMYKNYADDRQKPFSADGGTEQDAEEAADFQVEAAPLRGGVTQGHVA